MIVARTKEEHIQLDVQLSSMCNKEVLYLGAHIKEEHIQSHLQLRSIHKKEVWYLGVHIKEYIIEKFQLMLQLECGTGTWSFQSM